MKTTTEEMQALDPSALDSEALEAFFHHAANTVRVAQRLRKVELARGNRWPSPSERSGREETRKYRLPSARLPHSADPVGGL